MWSNWDANDDDHHDRRRQCWCSQVIFFYVRSWNLRNRLSFGRKRGVLLSQFDEKKTHKITIMLFGRSVYIIWMLVCAILLRAILRLVTVTQPHSMCSITARRCPHYHHPSWDTPRKVSISLVVVTSLLWSNLEGWVITRSSYTIQCIFPSILLLLPCMKMEEWFIGHPLIGVSLWLPRRQTLLVMWKRSGWQWEQEEDGDVATSFYNP